MSGNQNSGQRIAPLRDAANDARFARLPEGVELRSAYDQLRIMERVFVDAFVATDDPRKAIIATNSQLASKPGVADVRALELLRKPLVQAAIAERTKRITDRFEITAENVVNEIALIAFARMGDYIRISDDGEPFLDLSQIPENERAERLAAISEFTVEDFTDGRGDEARDIRKVKFKLHDKLSGLDKLMKKMGLYAPERLEHSGPGGTPIQSQQLTVTMSAEDAALLYQRKLEQS